MRVAKSYINYTFDESKAYEKNGKLYVKATCKCDRCVQGIYPCRIENNRPVPYPVANGVCFQCGGSGKVTKEIRLYTDKEYEAMERANKKAAAKKEEEREARMKAEYVEKRRQWIERNGFNTDEITYIYFPEDSYQVKDALKDAGFRFDSVLKWHCAEPTPDYANKVVKVKLNEVISFSAWGEGHYVTGAFDIVEKILKEARPQTVSEWFGTVKEKFTDVPVILKSTRAVETRYGISNLLKFETENGAELNWWTTKAFTDLEENATVLLSGTIKEHTTYKDKKITLITRCKIKGE